MCIRDSFWVARMIFSACEQTKQPPFHTVFLHGLVRAAKGRNMSKSLGNGIDPLEIAEKYGADALRFNPVSYTHLDVYKRQGLQRQILSGDPHAFCLDGGGGGPEPDHGVAAGCRCAALERRCVPCRSLI